ncbi:MAG: hypothetical protein JSU99_09335 [Nitrospiraceae bacterium]|nr:MAG: hypothetical protein JSU99_09335 [Nitrospiraceae bacterium]
MAYQINFELTLDCLDKDEILDRINNNADCVIVDTVGGYDGNKYKIKGAKTIPYPEIADRRSELSPYHEIIVYCKHKTCSASKKVASILTLLKVPNIKVYEGGIDEWVDSGLPIEEVYY